MPASEFATGKPLVGLLSAPGNGGDTQDDDNTDENGVDELDPAANGVSTLVIDLRDNAEPVEPGYAAEMDDADDHNGDLTVDFGFSINCPVLEITPSPLPAIAQYASVSTQLNLTGGTGSVTWTMPSGTLPSGITLSSSGLLSGTAADAGFYDFSVAGNSA